MNPDLPPPFTNLPPLPPVPQSSPPSKPPHFGWMLVLGIVLNLVSFGLCFLVQNPAPIFIIGAGTFVSVFYDGYRGIFIGFITTIGVALLVSLVVCGALIIGHK